MAEKRRYHRWECSLPCEFEDEAGRLTVDAVDISFDGACVAEPTASLEEGSDVVVTFTNDEELISLKAHVIYRHEEGGLFGIQFYGDHDRKAEVLLPLFRKYIEPES
ncbi:MAG: PilZ domain-containing protein [Acidobacteriota bacterium]|nr:MAG: PilZ domain-containing protein [Acidobacteriota bacterium]